MFYKYIKRYIYAVKRMLNINYQIEKQNKKKNEKKNLKKII